MSARREYEMFFKLAGGLDANFTAAFRNASSEMQALQTATRTLNTRLKDISAYQSQIKAIERQREQINSTEQRLQRLQERHRELSEQMNNTANPSERLRSQLQRNEEQIQACANSLGEQNDCFREMNNSLEESRTALQNAGIDTDDLTGSAERLQQQLQDLSNTRGFLQNVTQELRTAQQDFRDSITEFGKLAGGITAATATVYATTSKQAINFESAFAGVRKTVDATEEEYQQLKDGILDMSQTDVSAAAEEIAAVAEAAGQLGIQKDNILDFSNVMIDLGESTNLSATDAASQLAKFANITDMDPANYQRLGSVIVDLGNNFATTEADIVGMGTRLASTGELTGLTEAQIMAVSTALSSLGIEEEAGGTAMSKLLKMFQLANERGDMEEYAKTAGMTAEAFSDLYKQDSLKAISAWTKGLNDVDRNGASAIQILDDMGITEVRLSNAILALASSDDILSEATEMASAAWEENTALAEEAEKRYSTTESQIDMTKNAVQNLGVTIGDMTLPAIQDMAKWLNEAARRAQRWVKENPETIKQVAEGAAEFAKYALILKGSQVVFNGVRVGTLGAIQGVTKLKAAVQAANVAGSGKGFKTFISSLTGLSGAGAAAAVIGGIAAAVAALGAVLYVNIKQFQQYRKEITNKKLFDNGGQSLKEYTEELKKSTEQSYKYAQEVNAAAEELDGIDYELTKAKDSVELYNQYLAENGVITAEQADAMYEPFNEFVSKLEDDFKGRYDLVFSAFQKSAIDVADQLGISISEISGTLENFKARYTGSISESQQEINDILNKQRNGETLTDADWDNYRKEMQYLTDMANAVPNSNLSRFNNIKDELTGWDFGKDEQEGIENLNNLYSYAMSYVNELDAAQDALHNEYETLREQAKIKYDAGKSTREEYDADMEALKQAEQITYESYKTRRDEFINEFEDTWESFVSQIDSSVIEGMGEAGFNAAESFWNNFKGTLAVYGENYASLFTGNGFKYSDSDILSAAYSGAKADEYKLAAAKNEHKDLYDAAEQYKSGDFGKGAKDPGYSSSLTELKRNAAPKFIPTSALAAMSAAGIPGHASGTSYTENAFIAGENGPELITGAPGRAVFTADETRTILGLLPGVLASGGSGRGEVHITINSSPTFSGFGGENADELIERYNESLAEKIKAVLDERYEDVRRNAYSH